MSYAYALGYDVDIDTPVGTQTVSFDLDKVSQDVSEAMVAKSWPLVEARAHQSLPMFVDQAVVEAKPHLDAYISKITQSGMLFVGALGLTLFAVSWYQKQPVSRRRSAAA